MCRNLYEEQILLSADKLNLN